jgi:hypothetical protein
MKNLLVAAILGIGSLAVAQQSKPTPAPPTPQVKTETPPALSATEEAVRTLIGQKSQELNQLYAQYVTDLAKNHPGWHINPTAPLSTVLVKDTPEVKK